MKRLFAWIIDHPWAAIAGVLLITAGFGLALPSLEVNTDFETYIDHEDPAYVAKEATEERFGSSDILMIALVEPSGIYQSDLLEAIEEITARIEILPGVDEVRSPLNADLIEATDESLLVGPVAPEEAAPATPEEMAVYRDRVASSDMISGILVSEDGQAVNLLVTYATEADHRHRR